MKKVSNAVWPTIALLPRFNGNVKNPIDRRKAPGSSLYRILGFIYLSGFGGLALANGVPATFWQGELEVRQHAGSACSTQPSPPYRLPVWGARGTEAGGQLGRWLLWGDMQPVETVSGVGGQSTLKLLANGAAVGQLTWRTQDAQLEGSWHEAVTVGGCSFADAVLRMVPAQSVGADETTAQFSNFLEQVYQAQRDVTAAKSSPSASEPLARLVRLARQLPDTPMAAKSLAWAFMEGGQRAMALRQAEASLVLHGASTTLYRRVANQYPEDAALALAAHARALHRYQGLVQAKPLLAESLALLVRTGRAQSGAAASVLGMQGAWLLNKGQTQAALESFSQAVWVNEQRAAPLHEQVAGLMNLAAAHEDARNLKEALALYDRALGQLAKAGELTGDLETLQFMLQERQKAASAAQNRLQT